MCLHWRQENAVTSPSWDHPEFRICFAFRIEGSQTRTAFGDDDKSYLALRQETWVLVSSIIAG